MSGRKTLTEQLKDTVDAFSKRKSISVVPTERSIFIPSSHIIDESKETEDFVLLSRKIANTPEWNCKVYTEEHKSDLTGVEFIFRFTKDTDFGNIVKEIETRI